MRIMYLAPRFHTNQAAVIKGWHEHGDETMFVVRRMGKLEDHSVEKPVLLPYSRLFQISYSIYTALHRDNEYAHDFDLIYGIPSKTKFKKLVHEFKPDLVILREKSLYSLICYRILRKYRICTIIYNQSPLYVDDKELHRNWIHRLVDSNLPKCRITPVLRKEYSPGSNLIKTENSYFVPFIAEPICSPEKKHWFLNGKIRILEVGKFEKRKNHLLMLNAFEKLLREIPDATLLIVGEVSNSFHEEYLKQVLERINKSKCLKNHVTIKTNVPHNEMNAIYQSSDLYVLPSTGEPAAYSILEAMANSVAAVCSTGNGTASYIEPGITGNIFEDNDENSLVTIMYECVQNREKLIELGKNAYTSICNNYVFNNYYCALNKIKEMNSIK